jgi:hypothetical protein
MTVTDEYGVAASTNSAVCTAQQALRGTLQNTLRGAVALGHLLVTAKASCRHGDYGKWLKQHFEGTARLAEQYVALSRHYSTPDDVPAMSIREATKALAARETKPKQTLRHERISPATIAEASDNLSDIETSLARVFTAFEAEGLTRKHPAMGLVTKLSSTTAKLREYLKGQADAHEADSHECDASIHDDRLPLQPMSQDEIDSLMSHTRRELISLYQPWPHIAVGADGDPGVCPGVDGGPPQ